MLGTGADAHTTPQCTSPDAAFCRVSAHHALPAVRDVNDPSCGRPEIAPGAALYRRKKTLNRTVSTMLTMIIVAIGK